MPGAGEVGVGKLRLLRAAYAVASTAIMAVAQSVIPDERRAEGTGYFALGTTLATARGPAAGLAVSTALFLFMDVGIGFGPILLGTIISVASYATMYWILAVLVVVAGAVYFLVYGRTDAAKARL
ncbi:hypothetical protein MHK11_04215 [Corynebacterium aurimucosum]|nr:hypothetical protein [Corynebacterium aurimucosum]